MSELTVGSDSIDDDAFSPLVVELTELLSERESVIHRRIGEYGCYGAVLEQDGLQYPFDLNFEIPTASLRKEAENDEFHASILNHAINQSLFYGELMRRGIGLIPSDDEIAKTSDGIPINERLAFYRHPSVKAGTTYDLFIDVFEQYEVPYILIYGKTALTQPEVSQAVDTLLMDEKYTELQRLYLEHMKKIKEKVKPMPSSQGT